MPRPKQEYIIPEWVNHPAINKSWLCEELKGTRDKRAVGYFAQQRAGTRPFSKEDLERLEEIRKELIAGI